MMDELELLKKDWQTKEEHLPKLSYDEIYKMIWKKSSSIVRWILIISLLELFLPFLLYLLPSVRETTSPFEGLRFNTVVITFSVLQYIVILFFIYQFYKRYKEISILDNAKKLIQKIIRTRKTVKAYVFFTLGMIFFNICIFIVGIYMSDEVLLSLTRGYVDLETVEIPKLRNVTAIVLGISGLLLPIFIGGVYFLLYGLLLKRLNQNHKELKRMEM